MVLWARFRLPRRVAGVSTGVSVSASVALARGVLLATSWCFSVALSARSHVLELMLMLLPNAAAAVAAAAAAVAAAAAGSIPWTLHE